jgi:hypothetical protein
MRPSSLAAFAAVLVVSATFAKADPRPFAYTYDLYNEGKGVVEYEQWMTWKTHKGEDHGFDSFEFRHEIEIGITDNFDLSFYVPSWHYEDSKEFKGSRFDSVGVEAIVYLTSPVKDFIGIGLYQEINVGEHEAEFETKVLFQKDVGKWIFAYNLIFETEIEDIFKPNSSADVTGEFNHSLGVSYALSPSFQVGAEALVELEYENWSKYEKTNVFAGPVVSWRANEHFWVTGTALFQLSSEADEPDFQLRIIAGWVF